MTVKERTAGGYTKVETKNGVTRYHDPNGHPTNQQAFAGSKAQEQNDYEITERGESGEIKDTEVKDDDEEPPDPPTFDVVRITASFDADTDDTEGSHAGDSVEIDAEIGGVFFANSAPTDGEIEDKMKEIRGVVAEQMPFASDADINIERKDARSQGPVRGWDSFHGDDVVSVEFSSGWDEDYDVDTEQSQIEDW